MQFKLMATDGMARRGELSLQHGTVQTPAFMPVGTAGTVKALTVDQVKQTGADIILGNTYHLMLRPTAERVQRLGGLHRFMRWDGPILTDSGGFQVMSLSGISKVTEEAVTFARALQPEVILMDVNLIGDMDGIEAARQIREAVDARIIFVTAYGSADVLARIHAAAPDAPILSKPVAGPALLDAITRTEPR